MLLRLPARRDLLLAHQRAAPGTTTEAALRRRLADVAGLYDTHPSFDRRWDRPGPEGSDA